MISFARMIERMEDLILAGIVIPLTPWTIVNADKLVPLLDRIRESLPEVVQDAQRTINQRDHILEDAQRRAHQMIADAKHYADNVLSESELMKAVQDEAKRIRNEVVAEVEAMRKQAREESETLRKKAADEARMIKEGAEQYADTLLQNLDKTLADCHATIKNGQKQLRHVRTTEQKHHHQVDNRRHNRLMPPRAPQQQAQQAAATAVAGMPSLHPEMQQAPQQTMQQTMQAAMQPAEFEMRAATSSSSDLLMTP